MTDSPDQPPAPSGPVQLEPEGLDGHTIESLSDYLDKERSPRDESIETSPAAQHALAALSRLRMLAPQVIAAQADSFAPQSENWITRILDQIGVQAHAGRDIPVKHDVEGARLSISEGAIRALVRDVGDSTLGVLVERCRLVGDVETPGAPIEVQVELSTFEGLDLEQVTDDFRREATEAIRRHSDLTVAALTVRVRDTDLSDEEGRAL